MYRIGLTETSKLPILITYHVHKITMNAIIQSQLDSVELALNALVSSIESYNPSVPAAIDLLAADTELRKGVKRRELPLLCLSTYLEQI